MGDVIHMPTEELQKVIRYLQIKERARLAPPEPLPEDAEALRTALYRAFNGSPAAFPPPDDVRNWDAVARFVLSNTQRAVEAERQACIKDAERVAATTQFAERGAYLTIDAIRARGAAQEG